jgi:hypothetical protein
VILKSSNTGETWNIINSGFSNNLNSVHFINTDTGWIAGDNGLIIKSVDGGLTWIQQNSGLSVNVFKIEFCDANIGYALAHGGLILKSIDGGATWTTIYDSYDELLDIEFFNPNIGWVCGQGDIFRTNNGGYSWSHQFDTPYYDFRSLCLLDSSVVFSAGDDGLILLTTNGGQGPPVPVELISFTAISNGKDVVLNWSTATELNNQMFEVQRRSGTEEFFTIGYQKGHGTTTEPQNYTYTDKNLESNKYLYRLKQLDYLGTFQYSKEIEVDVTGIITFSLSQNFPNPFNPSTKIKFTIPQVTLRQAQSDNWVTLKVYDVLGNEIATLVNEEKQPGMYEVEFNGTGFPSGIYFYQLKAGNYIETKKMVLIK